MVRGIGVDQFFFFWCQSNFDQVSWNLFSSPDNVFIISRKQIKQTILNHSFMIKSALLQWCCTVSIQRVLVIALDCSRNIIFFFQDDSVQVHTLSRYGVNYNNYDLFLLLTYLVIFNHYQHNCVRCTLTGLFCLKLIIQLKILLPKI